MPDILATAAQAANALNIRPDFSNVNQLIGTQANQISNVGDIFSKIAAQRASQAQFEREQNLKELEYQEKIRQFNQGLLENALERENKLTIADKQLEGSKYSADRHYDATKLNVNAANERFYKTREWQVNDAKRQGNIYAKLLHRFTGEEYAQVNNEMNAEKQNDPVLQDLTAQKSTIENDFKKNQDLYQQAVKGRNSLIVPEKDKEAYLQGMQSLNQLIENNRLMSDPNATNNTESIALQQARKEMEKKFGKNFEERVVLDDDGKPIEGSNVDSVFRLNIFNNMMDKYANELENSQNSYSEVQNNIKKQNSLIESKYAQRLKDTNPGIIQREVLNPDGTKTISKEADMATRQMMLQAALGEAGIAYDPNKDINWQFLMAAAQSQGTSGRELAKLAQEHKYRTQELILKSSLEGNKNNQGNSLLTNIDKSSPYGQGFKKLEDINDISGLQGSLNLLAQTVGGKVNIGNLTTAIIGNSATSYGETLLGKGKAIIPGISPSGLQLKNPNKIKRIKELINEISSSDNPKQRILQLRHSNDDIEKAAYEIIAQSISYRR